MTEETIYEIRCPSCNKVLGWTNPKTTDEVEEALRTILLLKEAPK